MADLKTALILDSRIENLTDVESFGVKSSGQNITFQQYQALSATNSLVTYQIQIPSEGIACDRAILQSSLLTFTIKIDKLADGTDIPQYANVFNFGNTEAWAPFVLTNCFSTIQSTINNCSVSINIGDILPQLLRMTSQRDLQKYNSHTTALVDDQWGMYRDACSNYIQGQNTVFPPTNNNPLGAMGNNGYDNNFCPRGAFPTSVSIFQYDAGNTLVSHSSICATAGNRFEIVLSATFIEPILLSPFLNCMPHGNQAAFLGLNTLTLNLNVNNLQRVIRTGQTVDTVAGIVPKYRMAITGGCSAYGADGGFPAVSSVPLFQNTRLLCQFLTLQPSQVARIALRNVCEYTDFPRFITSSNGQSNLAGATYSNLNGVLPTFPNTLVVSNNIQLNQIPSRFIICVRVPIGSQTPANTDSFLSITGISINFNNKSGILASSQSVDLYNLAVKAGSTQSFNEWNGYQTVNQATMGVATNGATIPITYLNRYVPTTGSLFVLDAVDLGLEDYLSSGSLGQFNLQMNVQVRNQFPYAIVNPELCIICCNEGIFSTIAGSSSVMTGLLTREKVLMTKEQEPATDTESFRRFVGGVMSNSSMANAVNLIGKHYKKLPLPLANAIMGSGSSGGGYSGGGSSGGRRHLSRHFI